MRKIYKNAAEDIPSNASEPLGLSVQGNCYYDADHTENRVTRGSHTGILIFLNMSLTSWYSKK